MMIDGILRRVQPTMIINQTFQASEAIGLTSGHQFHPINAKQSTKHSSRRARTVQARALDRRSIGVAPRVLHFSYWRAPLGSRFGPEGDIWLMTSTCPSVTSTVTPHGIQRVSQISLQRE